MNNKIWVGIVVVAIVLILGYLFVGSGPTVSAQGTASIKAMPDEVSVNVNVETHNKTLQGAQEANKVISEALLVELVKIGYSQDELSFVNFYAGPEYDWRNDKQELKGYSVSQQLVVKTSDTGKVPSIIDAVIKSGALVSYINFEISQDKMNGYQNQALEAASKNAKEMAESKVRGQGKSLGRLVSLGDGNYNYGGPMPLYAMKSSAMDAGAANMEARTAAINISPDTQEISATVSATYKIGWF